ncbi:MAG: DNA primase [Candidatus Pacebacteria bacterium]|nr:DNA primase [Candidatus Paceibacterota bacterium]
MNPKDQVKENLSIVDVVSTYIRLEKSGSQYRARCPFHNEKSPSFYVSPERKSFHCFGCQQHGDIFTFVEKIENIPFFDALKILADRAGVQLLDSQKSKEDSRLVSLLKDATDIFEKNMLHSPEAKQYLMDRGLTEESIKIFHIGYAKNEWRDLFIQLAQKGYQPEEMEASGLMIQARDENGNTKGWYDRFRGRIMFPIRNVSGATVGYSGRIMPSLVDPTVAQGKYVNTPETPLYHKSKILFGYDTAKKRMSEEKSVVVVEGQMDLCMSYQAGIHNTVAVSGTAFTDEHIHLIKRFCDTVILSFDTDSAGQNALKKTALVCLLGGLDVYVVGDIGTKDPADLIRENKEAWLTAIAKKKHVIEVMLTRVLNSTQDQREQGKNIVTEVLPFVRAVQSPVDKAHFIRIISDKSHIPEATLTEELVRGTLQEPTIVKEEIKSMNGKERLIREIIAFSMLTKTHDDEKVIALGIDFSQFPETIIQEEIFKLEERVIGDKMMYLNDLIRSYKREAHREQLMLLQQKMRVDGADKEAILKEIYDHAKKGPEVILGE